MPGIRTRLSAAAIIAAGAVLLTSTPARADDDPPEGWEAECSGFFCNFGCRSDEIVAYECSVFVTGIEDCVYLGGQNPCQHSRPSECETDPEFGPGWYDENCYGKKVIDPS